MAKETLFNTIDLCDFPSDPNRVYGDLRKQLMLALRKVRRCETDRLLEEKGNHLLELLEFSQLVCRDAMGLVDEDGRSNEEEIDDPIVNLINQRSSELRDNSGISEGRKPKLTRNSG